MTTDTNLTKFDPNSLQDKLRERIKASLGDLIPDSAWDDLLKKEVDSFFKPKIENTGYGNTREVRSGFGSVVEEVMRVEVKNRLTSMLSKPEWDGYWTEAGLTVETKITEMAKTAGNEIIANWLSSALSMFVQNVKSSLHELGRIR